MFLHLWVSRFDLLRVIEIDFPMRDQGERASELLFGLPTLAFLLVCLESLEPSEYTLSIYSFGTLDEKRH